MQLMDETGQPRGAVGPVTSRFIGVQRGRKLAGVDPLTGKTLWTRDDVGPIDELGFTRDGALLLISGKTLGAATPKGFRMLATLPREKMHLATGSEQETWIWGGQSIFSLARGGKITWAGRACRIYGRLNDFPTVVLWPEDDTETEVSWALLARYIKAGGGNIRA